MKSWLVGVKAKGPPSLVQSSSHCFVVSWSSKYSSVASVTIAGGARPMRCHSRQPSIAQRRIAGHSALSFSGRSGSRSSGGIWTSEGHEQHAAAHGLVDVVEAGLVVADDPQLELGDEVEEVAAHEACGHLVAAGHGLDLGLVPAAAFLGFLGDDEAVAVQLGDVGRDGAR